MKNLFIYFFLVFLAFQSVNAQNCYPYPCAPCTIQGEVMTNSADCGLTNSVTVTLINGVAPFTFVIKKAGEDASPPVVQNSPTYTWTNLSPGHYYVWAIDSEGCIWTGQCENLGQLKIDIQSANLCGKDNYLCLWAQGGTPSYTYLWSNDSQYDCLYNVPTGTYTVTVTDANGCIETASSEVQTLPDVALNIATIQPTCEKLGEANLKALGGTPPYYFVVRKNGSTGNIIAIGSDSLLSVKNLTPGTYSVVVTDYAGCNQKGTFTIDPQPIKKETQVFLSGCGDVTLPWGEVVNKSGVFVKKYIMANGCDSIVTAVVTSATSQDSILNIEEHCGSWTAPSGQVFTESGYYLDSILGNDGCQKRLITGVFIKKPLNRIFLESYCYGTVPSTIIDGMEYNSDTIVVSGCDTTYIYFFTSEPNFISLPDTIFCLSPFSNPVNQEQIVGVIKNTSGCDSIVYYRNFIGIPVVMMTDTVTICPGEEFLWDKNNQTYNDQGLYMYIDSSSICKKYYQLVLFETEPGIVFQTTNTCDSLQAGFDLILGIGNCDPDTILLTTLVLNKKLVQVSICDGSKFIFQGLEYNLGSYSILVPGPDCDTVVTLIINQSPSIFFSSKLQNISCFGEDDGEISVEIFSDDPNITVEWSNGVMEEKTINLSPGNYSVTITNSFGCSAGESFTISEPQQLVLSVDTTNVTCKGDDGSITLEVSGGTMPYHFLWNDLYETQNLVDLSFGDYSVVVTDGNGCSESISTVLLEPECISPNSGCEVFIRSVVGADGPYVEINNNRLRGELLYQILDKVGRIVYEGSFGDISPGFRFKRILRLPLDNGAYFILFRVGNWRVTACFVIEK